MVRKTGPSRAAHGWRSALSQVRKRVLKAEEGELASQIRIGLGQTATDQLHERVAAYGVRIASGNLEDGRLEPTAQEIHGERHLHGRGKAERTCGMRGTSWRQEISAPSRCPLSLHE